MSAATLGFKARRRGIGLTALIDVVFILLMFFMLTSNFNQWHAVAINGVIGDEPTSKPSTPHIVFLAADQSIKLRDQSVRFEHYEQLTGEDIGLFSAEHPLIVVPEANVMLQDIVALMDRLKAIGVVNVSYGGVASHD